MIDLKEISGKRNIDASALTESDRMKYEIAAELGLMGKVQKGGWRSLTARESGQLGGLMAKRKKENQKKSQKKS